MAPVRPKSKNGGDRPSLRYRIPHCSTSASSAFTSSKRDKRLIKHSSFVNKIEKANTRPKKRRRPNKKLIADLASLADALPNSEDIAGGNRGVERAVLKQRSLKTSRGAQKRRQKLDQAEKQRFGLNMAQLLGAAPDTSKPNAEVTDTASSTSSRWEALRAFVGQNLPNAGSN